MKLCLHCGSYEVTLDALDKVPLPEKTATYMPVPHRELVESVKAQLPQFNLTVVSEAHALARNGNHYFGLLEVQGNFKSEEYGWVLGIRNSYNKVLPAGLVAGTQVFVCDNLAFVGSVKVVRKHTPNVIIDLPGLIAGTLKALLIDFAVFDKRLAVYKAQQLSDTAARDLIVRAYEAEAFGLRSFDGVLAGWNHPAHPEFADRNMWSFFNSVTGALVGHIDTLQEKTKALYELCDSYTGFDARKEFNECLGTQAA